jgi:hypothetical protein
MAASVRGISLSEFISNDYVLLFWTTSLTLSTILIVISVGYSEKSVNVDPKLQKARTELKELRKELSAAKATNEKAEAWKWIYNGTSKKDKVRIMTEKWPHLPVKAVATILETSETYVSQHRYKDKS